MTGFTPGPWQVVNGKDVFTSLGGKRADGMEADSNDGWQIADCTAGSIYRNGDEFELSFDEQKANARLIASAPDLLAALEKITAWIERAIVPDYSPRKPMPMNCADAVDSARAAITKATQP